MSQEATLVVSGMSCGHCKMSIEKALNTMEGVSVAVVNLDEKKVKVQFDGSKISLDQIKDTIEDQGYEVQ